MADAFAVWQTNYVFNVEQIVFSACEIDGCVSEGAVTCVAGVTSSQGDRPCFSFTTHQCCVAFNRWIVLPNSGIC